MFLNGKGLKNTNIFQKDILKNSLEENIIHPFIDKT